MRNDKIAFKQEISNEVQNTKVQTKMKGGIDGVNQIMINGSKIQSKGQIQSEECIRNLQKEQNKQAHAWLQDNIVSEMLYQPLPLYGSISQPASRNSKTLKTKSLGQLSLHQLQSKRSFAQPTSNSNRNANKLYQSSFYHRSHQNSRKIKGKKIKNQNIKKSQFFYEKQIYDNDKCLNLLLQYQKLHQMISKRSFIDPQRKVIKLSHHGNSSLRQNKSRNKQPKIISNKSAIKQLNRLIKFMGGQSHELQNGVMNLSKSLVNQVTQETQKTRQSNQSPKMKNWTKYNVNKTQNLLPKYTTPIRAINLKRNLNQSNQKNKSRLQSLINHQKQSDKNFGNSFLTKHDRQKRLSVISTSKSKSKLSCSQQGKNKMNYSHCDNVSQELPNAFPQHQNQQVSQQIDLNTTKNHSHSRSRKGLSITQSKSKVLGYKNNRCQQNNNQIRIKQINKQQKIMEKKLGRESFKNKTTIRVQIRIY